MRKHIFLAIIGINILNSSIISCCPCDFSPEDQRPFFEQYEEISPIQQKEVL